MHHNRSLLPDLEVLLGIMVKTSRRSTKLLLELINFYTSTHDFFLQINFKISIKFQPNFRHLTIFCIFNQILPFLPTFVIATKFQNFFFSELWPNFIQSVFGDCRPPKSVRLHSKKSFRRQILLTSWHLEFLGGR